MLDGLLPPWVRCAETTVDTEPVVLYPEEEALMARATPGRRREFGTARWCARRAMTALGLPEAPLPRGRRGMPDWPPGIVGSITHCDRYRAAALALADDAVALGIDAEPAGPLSARALEAVALAAERDRLADLGVRRPGVAWDRLLFSAKEAVYKLWSSAGGGWLGFEQADVRAGLPDADGVGDFEVRLLGAPPSIPTSLPRVLHGRWSAREGLVVTAIAVRR
ncbi:4'-phosphopantetheinyl transferase [Streptomyces sp. NPDC003023]|uniref:4'-phosphopantetheinyl transferase family protein n=1 Tax=Streptomyces sp. NPDC003023 TaxID=3364675 RepID=UPI0036C57528